MSSDVQSAVQLLLLSNAVSLAMVTVVVYDYILMFPSEVEYIWVLDMGDHVVSYSPLRWYLLRNESITFWHHIRPWTCKDVCWFRLLG